MVATGFDPRSGDHSTMIRSGRRDIKSARDRRYVQSGNVVVVEGHGACHRGALLKTSFRVQPARRRCCLGAFGTQRAAVRDGEVGATAKESCTGRPRPVPSLV